MAHTGDDFIYFVARQLTAFTGLGTLRHFDLQFVGINQVVGGDAETSRSHLFNGTAAQIAIGIAFKAGFIFAAFAGIGTPADAVHGDGERFVRFFGNGPERHGSGSEPLDDFAGGFHVFERNGRAGFEFKQTAQSA